MKPAQHKPRTQRHLLCHNLLVPRGFPEPANLAMHCNPSLCPARKVYAGLSGILLPRIDGACKTTTERHFALRALTRSYASRGSCLHQALEFHEPAHPCQCQIWLSLPSAGYTTRYIYLGVLADKQPHPFSTVTSLVAKARGASWLLAPRSPRKRSGPASARGLPPAVVPMTQP